MERYGGRARGHVKLTGAFLTGTEITNGINGVSVDQIIAGKVGQTTRFSSIELGTEPPRQGMAGDDPIALANTVSWSSPTQRISPEISPRAALQCPLVPRGKTSGREQA